MPSDNLNVTDASPVRPLNGRRRSIADLLAPLEGIVAASTSLISNHGAKFDVGGQSYELPRYLFLGPKGGGDTLRIGIFAGIHGDEPEGVHALVRFLSQLEAEPELAKGYCIFAYPVCNPTGFEDRTRHARSGLDPNRRVLARVRASPR